MKSTTLKSGFDKVLRQVGLIGLCLLAGFQFCSELSFFRHPVKTNSESGEDGRWHADHEQNAVHVGARPTIFCLVGELAVGTRHRFGPGHARTDKHRQQCEPSKASQELFSMWEIAWHGRTQLSGRRNSLNTAMIRGLSAFGQHFVLPERQFPDAKTTNIAVPPCL